MYFSEPALNEIDDARFTMSRENSVGLTAKLVTLARQKTFLLNQPGSADRVDFALKRARRAGRPVQRDLHTVTGPDGVFDIEVTDLHVGVLPFARFGRYGEGSRRENVRVFWAQVIVPSQRRNPVGSARELILLGSLDKVTNEPWKVIQAPDSLREVYFLLRRAATIKMTCS